MNRRSIPTLLLLLILVPAMAFAVPAKRTGRRAVVDGIAAQVDSVTILRSDVVEQAKLLAAQANVDTKDAATYRKVENDVLDRLVEEKVLGAEAHRQGVTVPESDLNDEVDRAIASARQSMGSEDAFQAQLKREGLTEETLRRKYQNDFRGQLMARRLVQKELQPRVTADTSDARAYFIQHRAELPPRPLTYQMSAILIRVKPGDAVRTKAHDKAAGVLARLKAGEDFAKLATLFSDDPSAREGGLLPWFGKEDFDSTFTAAAFAMKPGQTSDLVETRFGFHIIHVDSAKGDKLRARHILILVTPDTTDSAATLEKARAVFARSASEDFSKLAQQFSDDNESRARGGKLEPSDSASMTQAFPPEVVDAVMKLQPGQTAPLQKMQSGYVILRLDAKEPPRPFEYDEIAGRLLDMAKQDKFRAEYDRWLADLKKKHRVTVKYF